MTMNSSEMVKLMAALANQRGAFCSEMDFQLHLAWEMKGLGWELSLEHDPKCFEANAAIDILIHRPHRVALELKYKTSLLDVEIGGRVLRLKNQGAQDVARHDFIKDIWRLEAVVNSGQAQRGFAIFLTNDGGYWRAGKDDTADAMFRMFDGRSITKGSLRWGSRAGQGTIRGRATPISLTRDYVFGWRDYSNFEKRNGVFRYLMVEVQAIGRK